MLSLKFLLGVVLGMIILHLYYKKKHNITADNNQLEAERQKIVANVEEFLKDMGSDFDANKVANDLVNGDTITNAEVSNYGGKGYITERY